SFTCRSSKASSARCFEGPSASGRSSSTTSTGPRIRNSIERLVPKVTPIGRDRHIAAEERLYSGRVAAPCPVHTRDGDVRDPDSATDKRHDPRQPRGAPRRGRARRQRPPRDVHQCARTARVPRSRPPKHEGGRTVMIKSALLALALLAVVALAPTAAV